MARPNILIVDDEAGIRQSLEEILREEGWQARSVATGEECLAELHAAPCDLVLLDVWLPGKDGLQVLHEIKKDGRPDPAVIMISGHGTIETAVKATKLGAYDFLEKPLKLDRTVLLVRHALEQLRLNRENLRLRAELRKTYEIVGESVPIKALRQQIEIIAPTNGRVLIYGESGTGKELVARALHGKSLRAHNDFVEVNCAAIPEELIESELFGHRKGAFTGATEDKEGKFRKADGGTLFLDEIGDMSLRTQSKVLRVLEEQRIEPLGTQENIDVDVRVLAATNKNLSDEMAQGRFREDLFYRLNVIPFHLPPLRERVEDIPLLARTFLEEFTAAYGRKPKEFTPGTLQALEAYPWPGNVRELRNLVERLVILCESADHIQKQHLPPEYLLRTPRPGPATTLEEARTEMEKELILRKLEESRWNVSRTAESLGIDRSHLHRKMKALGISLRKT